MTLFVTGASGFLGSHVLPLLLEAGHYVVAPTRRRLSFDHLSLLSVNTRTEDYLTPGIVPWDQIDAVLHLAASGVKSSHRNWADALEFNVVGTQRLLNAVTRYASKRPAFIMTRTFYEHLVHKSPALLENPYIATKRAAAELVTMWAETYPGPVSFATVFQVFGPGDDPANVLSYAAKQIASGEPATFGSGRGLRDWIYIDDAAQALVAAVNAAISHPANSPLKQDIGTGKLLSIREMIETLAAIAPVETNPSITFDASRDRPDVEVVLKASHLPCGWHPSTAPDAGVAALLASF